MRGLAEAAGVSVGTVSLALRGHPSISQATRERIQKLAEQLGYRPNARIAELMGEIRRNRCVGNLSETVAMLWSDATEAQVREFGHLAEFELGARQRLEQLGFGLDIFYKEEKMERQLVRILRARGIRGILLAPLINLRHRHLNWDWSNFCVMIAGSGLWRPDFHRVRFNHFEEMSIILHHLRHEHPKKIGLINDKLVDSRAQKAITGGFLAHVGELKHSIYDSDGNDREKLLVWLQRFKPDRLIIGCSPAVSWVLESGFKTRIFLVSQYLHQDYANFSGIREDYERLGKVTAEQLMGQLITNQLGVPAEPMKTYLTGKWEVAKK